MLSTVGNADPPRLHSELLFERLRAQGIEPETHFFPDDYQPPLGHEYQLDLDTSEGRRFLERLLAFPEQCSRASAARSWPSTPRGAGQSA